MTLTAYYDLAVSPLTFDIIPFLIAADIERARAGCDDMHLVIVPKNLDKPNLNPGMISDFSTEKLEWRLRQIVTAAAGLVPTCKGVSVFAERGEVAAMFDARQAPVYPESYRVAQPLAGFSMAEVEAAALRGDQIPSLRANTQAVEFIQRWISPRARGRKVISITLREADYGDLKNSDREAWVRFAHWLDSDLYLPVFVRDTDAVFDLPTDDLSQFESFPMAPVNLELRTAFYEQCFVNMVGSSGPTQLCLFDDAICCLIHRLGVPGGPDTEPVAFESNYGIKIGSQLPHMKPHQRLVWGLDNFETTSTAFERMVRFLENGSAEGLSESDRIFFQANTESAETVGRRLYDHRQWGPVRKIFRHLSDLEPDNSEFLQILGKAETWCHEPEKGMALFERSIEIDDSNSNSYLGRGEALLFTGQAEKGVASIRYAISLDPNNFDAYLRLALLYEAQGELEAARELADQAIALNSQSADAHNCLALIHRRQGNTVEAERESELAKGL